MPYTIQKTWQAETAIESLSAQERAQVQIALDRLRVGDFTSVPQVYRVHGREGEPDFSVLRVNERLRLLFVVSKQAHVITVRDLINRDFVRRYG